MTTPATETTPAVEKAAKIVQNGITRPATGTTTGRIWEIADNLSTEGPAKRAPVLAQCKEEGINNATAATQYGRWRKFYGLGKEEKEVAPAAEADSVEEAPVAEAGAAE